MIKRKTHIDGNMTVFFLRKMIGIALALRKRKPSKKNQRRGMKESFKQLKVQMEEINKQASSNVAPRKGIRSSWLKVAADVRKLEKVVAKKRAETSQLRQQLMEGEAKVQARLEEAAALRTLNALLFLKNSRQENLLNDLTRRFLG